MINDHVATDDAPEWREMRLAPWGYKCLLLTQGGVAVIGVASHDDTGYIAWCPMPRISKQIKQLLAGGGE